SQPGRPAQPRPRALADARPAPVVARAVARGRVIRRCRHGSREGATLEYPHPNYWTITDELTSRVGRVFEAHRYFGGPRRLDPPYDNPSLRACRSTTLASHLRAGHDPTKSPG